MHRGKAATDDSPYRARGRPSRDCFANRVVRCPDPLLPNGMPQQFVEAVYPRYASPSGLDGPFGSEASLREFFTLELARSPGGGAEPEVQGCSRRLQD